MEKFKHIKGYEGLYKISEDGIVFSCARNGTLGGFLKSRVGKFGYEYVILSKNNKRKTMKIHRLVAITFIPNPENKSQVNHIDGNKLNNCVSNLEWCTHSENQLHSFRELNRKNAKGQDSKTAKITNEDADQIRLLYKTGLYSQSELGKLFNLHQTNIWNILHYKTYIPDGWIDAGLAIKYDEVEHG